MAKIENTLECVEKLMDIMKNKGATRFTYQDKDCEIDIEMKSEPAPVVTSNNVTVQSDIQNSTSTPQPVVEGNIVKAPIIGTFYSASSPDAEPFVKVGQTVHKGDVLFIIESMKVMNEVKSEFDGTVMVINVKDGEAVEYDQPIMIIS